MQRKLNVNATQDNMFLMDEWGDKDVLAIYMVQYDCEYTHNGIYEISCVSMIVQMFTTVFVN